MAGEARTPNFVLSGATVMIGDVADMMDLNPDSNSIGLVKNFSCVTNPSYTDLTQGARGQIVYSVMTKYDVMAKMEVYEYTAANMNYSLGLEGKGIVAPTATELLTTALTGSTGTPVVTATFTDAVDKTATWASGSWFMIQDSTEPDHVHVAKLSAATTKTGAGPYVHTLTFSAGGLKTGNNFPAGSVISLVNSMDIGIKAEQQFFSAKVTATLPEASKPFTIVFPKIRIIKGFNLAFNDTSFANMPFEFQPYELLPTDTWYGADYPGVAKLFVTT